MEAVIKSIRAVQPVEYKVLKYNQKHYYARKKSNSCKNVIERDRAGHYAQ